MTMATGEPDPLDIKELLRQAEAYKKAWRLPKYRCDSSRPDVAGWQELMSDRPVKPRRFTKRED